MPDDFMRGIEEEAKRQQGASYRPPGKLQITETHRTLAALEGGTPEMYARQEQERKQQAAADRLKVDLDPTPFVWRDPSAIPPRPWLYGRHLIRKQVSVTVAPGGVGKSSLTICEGLAMASGRELLGEWTERNLKVWIFNLEDPRDELDRRIVGAMQHYRIAPDEIAGRLFVDSGRERGLCTAVQTREGVVINKPEIDALAHVIEARGIDVLVVDPFVSSHQANENDNGAIDLVAKEWARLADRCNCAIELVHHTRKTNGEEATTEGARGASALLGAARSGRVLNKMPDAMKAEAGVQDDPATYFAVDRDKANLAPVGARLWRRMASVHLANGDSVGVAEVWHWPDTFDGMKPDDLLAVQRALDGKGMRYSDQSGDDWAGCTVAEVLGLNPVADKKRIKKMIEAWLRSGALKKVKRPDANRIERPCLEVGEWATE
ncbi:AAA family ATPase [Mangrovicoccus sp. HB161399]|uniref:AAA family ATPase n=1 Tax=Mangrovicoccus sp. HB161399 TaxID=2720392 RepID=UPI0020A629D3|nr:AAA family ATPase [Mangrovicoccus sp. HB161399]